MFVERANCLGWAISSVWVLFYSWFLYNPIEALDKFRHPFAIDWAMRVVDGFPMALVHIKNQTLCS